MAFPEGGPKGCGLESIIDSSCRVYIIPRALLDSMHLPDAPIGPRAHALLVVRPRLTARSLIDRQSNPCPNNEKAPPLRKSTRRRRVTRGGTCQQSRA